MFCRTLFCCPPPLLQFTGLLQETALDLWVGASRKVALRLAGCAQGAGGGALAGGAYVTRGASGSERPRAAMSSPASSLPQEIYRSAEQGELQMR